MPSSRARVRRLLRRRPGQDISRRRAWLTLVAGIVAMVLAMPLGDANGRSCGSTG